MENQGKEKRESSKKRRRFIMEEIDHKDYVTLQEIQEASTNKGFGANPGSIEGDKDFFEDYLDIKFDVAKKQFYLDKREPTISNNFWPYSVREKRNKPEKEAIGAFVAGLIWGDNFKDNVTNQLRAFMRSTNAKREETRKRAEKILNYLEIYWLEKHHKFISLDAGTTTAQIAHSLSKKNLPDVDAKLSSLCVLTNAPSIVDILKNPGIKTDVFILGGQLRKDTTSVVGFHTDKFIEICGMTTDISIVGTTSVVKKDERICGFACDSPEETQIKSRLLDKGNLKIVVMDSSKFIGYSSAFTFAPLSSQFIHLVITDDSFGVTHRENKTKTELDADEKIKNKVKEYQEFIMGNGIPVLLAGKKI